MMRLILAVIFLLWLGQMVPHLLPLEGPAVVEPSPLAPTKSPRPLPRDCAGTVTNNPAIQDWRLSLGC